MYLLCTSVNFKPRHFVQHFSTLGPPSSIGGVGERSFANHATDGPTTRTVRGRRAEMPRHKERTSVHDEGERRETFFDEAQLGTFTSLTASSSGSGLDKESASWGSAPHSHPTSRSKLVRCPALPNRSLSFCISHASVR